MPKKNHDRDNLKKSIEDSITFLIYEFNQVGIKTSREDWNHEYDLHEYHLPKNRCHFERCFYHHDMGYINVMRKNKELSLTIPTLDIFRRYSGSADLGKLKIFFDLLMKQYHDPNISHDHLFNLTNACRFGQLKNVQYLVSQGVDIHVKGEVNLLAALSNHHYEVAQYLLDNEPAIEYDSLLSQLSSKNISFLNHWSLTKTLDHISDNHFKKTKI